MHSWSHTMKKADRWAEDPPAMKKKMIRMTAVKKKVHHGVCLPLHAGDSHDMRWSQLFTLTPLRLNRRCSSADISSSSEAAAAAAGLMDDCDCCVCSLQRPACEHVQNLYGLCQLLNLVVHILDATIETAQHYSTGWPLPMLSRLSEQTHR